MAESNTFLKDYVPIAISLIALIQVWIIALWKRFISKGSADIHKAANLEVGFSSLGPTVGMFGTIRAINKDIFVQKITVKISSNSGEKSSELEWRIFRPNQLPVVPEDPKILEIASGISVRPDSPHKFNILFSDDSFIKKHKSNMETVQQSWEEFKNQRIQMRKNFPEINKPGIIERQFLPEFMKLEKVAMLSEELAQDFLWQPGKYQITVFLDAAKPARSTEKKWEFELSDDNVLSLKENIESIIKELCGYRAIYKFAFPSYNEVAKK